MITTSSSVDSTYDEYYFQLLIFDKDLKKPEEGLVPEIVYGKKKDLINRYGTDISLPTSGVKVDEEFIRSVAGDSQEGINGAIYFSVRELLMTRVFSQVISLTWLNDETKENIKQITSGKYTPEQIELIAKTLISYAALPKTYWLSDRGQKEPLNDFNLEQRLLSEDEDLTAFIKKPSSEGYFAIKLALLLAGQAYYVDKSGGFELVLSSLASTYEIVNLYTIDKVSWDTFYGDRINKICGSPGDEYKDEPAYIGPYIGMTIPYPPQPSESNLKQDDILTWAIAPLHSEEDSQEEKKLSFYPPKKTWHCGQRPRFVRPPYPYIPVSTC